MKGGEDKILAGPKKLWSAVLRERLKFLIGRFKHTWQTLSFHSSGIFGNLGQCRHHLSWEEQNLSTSRRRLNCKIVPNLDRPIWTMFIEHGLKISWMRLQVLVLWETLNVLVCDSVDKCLFNVRLFSQNYLKIVLNLQTIKDEIGKLGLTGISPKMHHACLLR